MSPNGHSYDAAEFNRLEAPLRAVDGLLERFALEHSIRLGRNYRGDPERSLTRSVGSVECLIQIYPVGESRFAIWLCASKDRGDGRYWKQETLCDAEAGTEPQAALEARLSEAYTRVTQWAREPSILEFATRLQKLP